MIIASVRQESLSGGGKFAINWTGLTGPRFEYRKKFEHYHNQIQQGLRAVLSHSPMTNENLKPRKK